MRRGYGRGGKVWMPDGGEGVSVGNFSIFMRMIERDDKALKLAPLSNIIGAQASKRGTVVTIGVEGNVVTQICRDEFVGGLLLCDRKRFEEIKAEMENEASA